MASRKESKNEPYTLQFVAARARVQPINDTHGNLSLKSVECRRMTDEELIVSGSAESWKKRLSPLSFNNFHPLGVSASLLPSRRVSATTLPRAMLCTHGK